MSDRMQIEFGFHLDELMTSVQLFSLKEDKQYMSLMQIANTQRQTDEKKFLDECMPNAERKVEYLKEAEKFGKAQFKADQTLTFDFFLNTKCHSLDWATQHQAETFEKMKAERREELRKLEGVDNKESYYLMLMRKVAMQTITEQAYDGAIYQHLKVPEKVYVKSMQTYLMQPDKRKQYEEETEKARTKHIEKKPREMTREQVFECAQLIEKFKFDAQVKMYNIVRA